MTVSLLTRFLFKKPNMKWRYPCFIVLWSSFHGQVFKIEAEIISGFTWITCQVILQAKTVTLCKFVTRWSKLSLYNFHWKSAKLIGDCLIIAPALLMFSIHRYESWQHDSDIDKGMWGFILSCENHCNCQQWAWSIFRNLACDYLHWICCGSNSFRFLFRR